MIEAEHFNIDVFKNLATQRERIAYCHKRLKFIGSGTSRTVYKLDENKVIKLAISKIGISQNKTESSALFQSLSCFTKVYDNEEFYRWIISEYAEKLNKVDFESVVGYNQEAVNTWFRYVHNSGDDDTYTDLPDYVKEMNDKPFFADLKKAIENGLSDLSFLSWGTLTDDEGNQRPIIFDYGIIF